jgi:hypothetical protein
VKKWSRRFRVEIEFKVSVVHINLIFIHFGVIGTLHETLEANVKEHFPFFSQFLTLTH